MEKEKTEKQKQGHRKNQKHVRNLKLRMLIRFANEYFLRRLSEIHPPELRMAVHKKVSANIKPGATVDVRTMAILVNMALKELRPLYPQEEKKPETLGYRVVRKRV